MIYISTGGFKHRAASDTVRLLAEDRFLEIELSGGLYEFGQLEKLKNLQVEFGINYKVHNYFPPPLEPFVFNLASLDQVIANLSIQHAKRGIDFSAELNGKEYSFHAGFLLDPRVSELGKGISAMQLYNRDKALDEFIKRINILSEYAQKKDISLLIENNVVSRANYEQFFGNPFLMSEAVECIYVMNNTPDNVNMLIDVAHLKVSAQSMGFDPTLFLNKCKKWIKAYHLSDNNGLEDENKEFESDTWFWPYLIKGLDYYSLEVYTSSLATIHAQRNLSRAKVF